MIIDMKGTAGGGSGNITIFKVQDRRETIVESGKTRIVPDSGYDGISSVELNVDIPRIELQEVSKTYVENGVNEIVADEGKAMSKAIVTVNVPEPVLVPLDVAENGTYNPQQEEDGFSSVVVNVPIPTPKLEEKNLGDITANGPQSVVPSQGFDGISKVDFNVNVPIPVEPVQKIVMKDFPRLNLAYMLDPDLSKFDFTGVTDWLYMFKDVRIGDGLNKQVLDLYDVSKDAVGDLREAFSSSFLYLKELKFNFKKITYMRGTFKGSMDIEKLNVDCPECVNMDSCFDGCNQLTDFTLNNTGKVKNFSTCFQTINSLKLIKGTLDMTSCENTYYMFGGSWGSNTTLTTFTMTNLGTDLNIKPLKALDKPSLLSIVNTAQDVTANPKTLTLSAEMFALLSDEEKAPMIAKGWSIVQG